MASETALTADELFAALPDRSKSRRIEPVPLPEAGEGKRVYVRELTSAEQDRFDAETAAANAAGKTADNWRARFVATCCCDESGKLLFPLPAQVAELGNRSPAVVQRIFGAARKLNPPVGEDVEGEKKGSESEP